jgi:hypothetical protein
MITVSADPDASGSEYMSPWRSSARARPASASLTRASRSISGERSMPSAWVAAGPNSSIIRPVPVPMSISRPIARPSGPAPRARAIAASTSVSATWSERNASHSWAWPAK